MKQLFLFIITVLLSLNSFAQFLGADDNNRAHRRYWYYRTRFINDFINIGDRQGDCICFPERNYEYSEYSKFYAKIGPDQIDITNQYLMALALEYKLLSRSNQSTEETVKEIFYLIKTINRLDSRADWFWEASPPQNDNMNNFSETSNLNGFMLREDMPHDYFSYDPTSSFNKNYNHFNYAKTEYNSTATYNNLSYTGLHEITNLTNDNKFSNYEDFYGSYNTSQKEELTLPHDKYYSMFLAFMFIVKYIPDGTRYYENGQLQTFQDGESDIKTEVRKITNRCHPYLRGNRFGGNGSNWIMEYPDGTNLQGLGQPLPYSFPLAKIICDINGSFPFNVTCNSYQDATSLSTGQSFYIALNINPIPSNMPLLGSEDASVFLAYCQAGSNAGLTPLIPAWRAMDLNSKLNHVEWGELMRKVLHQNGTLAEDISTFANPINVAPCQGPYNFGINNRPNYEWTSQDRLEHPGARGSGSPFPGNYPGVDYMLSHNLYYEYQNQLLENPNGNVFAAGAGFGSGMGNGNGFNNFSTWVYNNGTNSNNSIPNTLCNIGSSFVNFFGASTSCNSSGNGGSGSGSSASPYTAYNYMDNQDNSVWPNGIYTGPRPTSNSWYNNPNNPNSPYNPNNPYGHYSNPSNFIYLGTAANPAKVGVFQNLTSTSHIYFTTSPIALANTTPANVIYRAGKCITFSPGFQVDAGAEFFGYISRYICNGDNDALNMRKQKVYDEDGQTIDLNHYEDDIISNIPIHYVEGPKSDSDKNPKVAENPEIDDLTSITNIPPSDFYKGNDFNVLPNPSNGIIRVITTKLEGKEKLTIRVYDMKGQLLLTLEDVPTEQEINLEGYGNGVYLIQVSSNLGKSTSKKVDVVD